MYQVKDVNGNIIAITSRVEDATAMCSFEKDVSADIENWAEKNLEPEEIQFLSKENLIKLYWKKQLASDPAVGWEIVEV